MKGVIRLSHIGRPRDGFTLVELLVAVLLIAILMALLLPALSAARETGRRTSCLSNMRQLTVGMTMYADDNNGHFPPYLYSITSSNLYGFGTYDLGFLSHWSMAKTGPLRNKSILVCPSDKNPSLIATTDANGNPITIRSSYGYNFEMLVQGVGIGALHMERTALLFDGKPDQATAGYWFGAGAGAPNGTYPTFVCHIPPGNPAAAGTIQVGSVAALNTHLGHGDYVGPCTGEDYNQFATQLLDPRHEHRANVLFVDGHGEFLTSLPTDSLTVW